MTLARLPIDGVVPQIVQALHSHQAVVVRAQPGAGKTTRVPPALLDAKLTPGQVWVLEPRRMAARAVARRIAEERGQALGREVGFQVRHETVGNANTRLWVLTEGILTSKLQNDPLLDGVGIVVLDEFHERSVHADLAIAFLRELQEVRDDLKVVVMSATLEGESVSHFLGDAPVIDCEGRTFPLDVQHLTCATPVEGAVAAVESLVNATNDDGGDFLVFMPGVREIDETTQALRQKFSSLKVLPLHGAMRPEDQDLALQPVQGQRRIIVATNIAETSLTIPGVTAVVDSGLVRQLEASVSTGVDELVTRRVSRASAAQRAGRAGRVAPGRVVRLWSRAEDERLEPYDLAEIHRIDLSGPALELAAWGAGADFRWFEEPPRSRLERARELLEMLGALEGNTLTPLGRALHGMPLHPRLAAMIEAGKKLGCARAAAELAAILSEPDFVVRVDPRSPPANSDLLERRKVLPEVVRGQTGSAHRAGFEVHIGRARAVEAVAHQLMRKLPADSDVSDKTLIQACAAGFPDRIALKRARGFAFSGGGSATLGPESLVRDATCLLAHTVFGTSRDGEAVIRSASAFEVEWLGVVFPGAVRQERKLSFDDNLGRVVARQVTRFWGLPLSETQAAIGPEDTQSAAMLLAEAVVRRIESGSLLEELQARVSFLNHHCPDLNLPSPAESHQLWEELCWGQKALKDLPALESVFLGQLTAAQRRLLDEEAPTRITVPSGSSIALTYRGVEPPILAVRLQEVFGWRETPRVALGRVPVLLHLLAPNYRPAQVTNDLQSFWTQTYPQIRKELRARYPKHPWPEDPFSATAIRK